MLATKIEEAKKDEGFTLIELLVVVIIIGILAAIAIPVFLNQRERAWVRAADSDARNIAIEIETYFNDGFAYPANEAAVRALDINFSSNVDIVEYDNRTNSYCLSLNHALADEGGGETATYDSAAGGLQARGTACP